MWAFLTLEDICSRKTDKEIRQALQEIPHDLPTVFNRALSRIVHKRNQDIAKKTFALTTAVLQPLTLPQIREALSVEIGQHTLHQDDLIRGISRLPAWCENLIYVEETDDTVHFSHHSIREFLLTPDSGELEGFHIKSHECDQYVGEVCITYISLENFQTTLAEKMDESLDSVNLNVDMGGITQQTVQAAVRGNVGVRMGRLARRMVKSPLSGKSERNDTLAACFPKHVYDPAQGTLDYPFLQYATENWFKHTANLEHKSSGTTWKLLGRIIRRPENISYGEPWHDKNWRRRARDEHIGLFEDIETTFTSLSISIDLCFVFIYANNYNYCGLACCAFMQLAEEYNSSIELRWVFHSSTINQNHQYCHNQCFRLVFSELERAIVMRNDSEGSIAHLIFTEH